MKVRFKLWYGAVVVMMMTFFMSSVVYMKAAVIEDEEEAPAKPARPAKKAKEVKKEDPISTSESAENSTDSKEGKSSRVKKVDSFPFYVFKDKGSGNHYIPSGWMGDYGDLKISANWTGNPHSGATCLKITYSAKGAQGAGWAGIYWQHPANNWGDKGDVGYNLTGAQKVTFWVRGETGNEVISEFKVGGIQGEFSDTDVAGIGPVKLTKEWKQYAIDLAGKDLSRIAGGFCWATSGDENPDGLVMYLDDIVYEK